LPRPNGLLVAFICNHCPYVQAVIERIVRDARELAPLGFGVAAISANDPLAYPEDSFELMGSSPAGTTSRFHTYMTEHRGSRALRRRLYARLSSAFNARLECSIAAGRCVTARPGAGRGAPRAVRGNEN